ncbi:hypothetical protein [Oceanobacter mangrovi]|uniref:hypothetical protein n=1 Tax=Oceanobacter mangrovi TaxID=2862510 RepID=UPI001C8D2792|nr:hypothetical protein [Oceanobacter mangrovi]
MRLAIAVAALLTASQALALTDKEIDQWITSMPKLDQWMEQHPNVAPEQTMQPGQGLKEVYQQGINALKSAGLYSQFNSQVMQYGFNSVEHWAEVSTDISMAMLALENDEPEGARAQIQQQLAQLQQLRSSNAMPAEQLDSMEQLLKSSLQILAEADQVPTDVLEMVKRRKDDIESIME